MIVAELVAPLPIGKASVELKGPPPHVKTEGSSPLLPCGRRDRCLEPTLPDVAPRSEGVRDDVDRDHPAVVDRGRGHGEGCVLREEWEAQEIAGAFRYEHLGDMIYDASAIVEQCLFTLDPRQEMAERREILRHKAYSPAKGTTTNKVLVRIL